MPSKRGSRNRPARRASLGSLVDRVKSSSRRIRTAAKPSAAGTRRSRVAKRQSSLAPRTVVVGTLCVVAAAALIMSRQSSIVNWVAEIDAAGNIQRVEQVDHFDPSQVTLPETTEVAPRASTRAVSLTATPAPAAKREPAPVTPAPAAFTPEPAATAEPAPKMTEHDQHLRKYRRRRALRHREMLKPRRCDACKQPICCFFGQRHVEDLLAPGGVWILHPACSPPIEPA